MTAVWVPDEGHEALRDPVRARQAANIDEKRARHRLGISTPSQEAERIWTDGSLALGVSVAASVSLALDLVFDNWPSGPMPLYVPLQARHGEPQAPFEDVQQRQDTCSND